MLPGIVDGNNELVIEYNYDVWGKLFSTTGSLATTIGTINPFLYRGYYYDSETGLYYLNSRYYDPQTRRFINADDTSTLQAFQGELLSTNLFAYCENNPVIYSDPNGNFINAIIGGLVGGGVGWLMAKVTGGNATAGAVSGAVGGLISGLGVDLAIGSSGALAALVPILGAAGSFAQTIIYRGMTERTFDIRKLNANDYKSIAISCIIGAAFNTVSFGVAKSLSTSSVRNSSLWQALLNSLRSPLTKNFDENLASIIMIKYLGLKQSVTDYIFQQITQKRAS